MSDEQFLDRGLITDAALLAAAPATALIAMAASALVNHGADMASGQLVLPDGRLVLVAHPGFGQPFADQFATVSKPETSCAVAYAQHKTIEVDDIADDPIFNGTDGQTILLDAGARAVTSFPLFDSDGNPIGVISTHYRSKGHHDPAQAQAIVQRLQQRLADNHQPHPDEVPLILENSQLREALASRNLIAQAKGILMASQMLDEEAAFRLLRDESQQDNIKVRDVAARIVDQHNAHVCAQRAPV